MLKTAGLYLKIDGARVGHDLSRRELSPVATRDFARVYEYVDLVPSGSEPRQSCFADFLEGVRRQIFEVVLVGSLDSIPVRKSSVELLLKQLEAHGVAFISLSDGIDTSLVPVKSAACWTSTEFDPDETSTRGARRGPR